MEFIGIDVHKRESQVCILAAEGEVVVEQRIRTERGRFAELLGTRPKARILMEASTESEWVARCLEALGHEVVVADPNFSPMYATRSRKVKTDLRGPGIPRRQGGREPGVPPTAAAGGGSLGRVLSGDNGGCGIDGGGERRAGALCGQALPAGAQGQPAQSEREPMASLAHAPGWGAELAVAFLGLVLTGSIVALFHHPPGVAQSTAKRESHEGDIVSVGDHAIAAPVSMQAPMPLEDGRRSVGGPLPERPLEGQRRPPCNRYGEVEIRGGCWYRVGSGQPPCKEEGKEDGYAWKGACYSPSYPPQRQPTSDSP